MYKTVKLSFTAGHQAQLMGLRERHSSGGPLFALNVLDAAPGEEDLAYIVPSVLLEAGIPYTGCSTEALFLTTDKIETKRALLESGLPTPQCVTESEGSFDPQERYILKARSEDASVGLGSDSVVEASSLEELLSLVARKETTAGKSFFAERDIGGI